MSRVSLTSETNQKIEVYIGQLCHGMVGTSNEINEFRDEMTSNLLSSVEELVGQGETEEQAVRIAIDRFGELRSVKEELKQIYKIRHSFSVGILTMALTLLVLAVLSFGVFIGIWDEWLCDKYAKDAYHLVKKEIAVSTNETVSKNLDNKIAKWVKGHWGVNGVAVVAYDGAESKVQIPSKVMYAVDKDTEQYLMHWANLVPDDSTFTGISKKSTFFMWEYVNSYGHHPNSGDYDPKEYPFIVHIAMNYFNYTFFYSFGYCTLAGYWLMFALWASMNVYYDGRGKVHWIIIFAALNIVGYLFYLHDKKKSLSRQNLCGML
ncbi:permease prefix domain 1-containing protein [Paenibacillus puldeungensis]|uniref:Permease prefix domain 1-containing protein n=1 Tax=Paenibacillus puldeungensis TaxID=696536 RepID=A0ABW3S0W9_9BACL